MTDASSVSPPDLPSRARVVIVGAGIGGASIALHLAELGCTDVLVVDRHEPTSGSTFHSAGLVGQLRSSLPVTRMMMHSVATYERLEAMAATTGRATGWQRTGSLRLASSPERLAELRRQHGWSKTFGLETELLSAEEARQLFPLMSTDGVLGALYLATDGQLDPSSVTHAMLGAARDLGVRLAPHTAVEGFGLVDGRVRTVRTDRGDVDCESVILACGMFTAQVAALAGVTVPIVPIAHQYLITKPIEGVGRELPSFRDPDRLIYFRNSGGGLVAGGYERNPAPWSVHGVPGDFNYRLLDEDWDRFEPLMSAAVTRVPAIEEAEIVQLLNGPEGFTPDNEFVLGESEVHGLFVAAGFCAHGIAGAGGVGRVIAEWVLDGAPSLDCWKMDIRRFGPHFASRSFAVARTVEVYSTYYDIHYPSEERSAGRPLRRSAAYPALAELGCEFGEKGMWERPNWFPGNDAADRYEDLRPHGWAGHHWHPAIVAESLACRRTAALFDESSFAKFRIEGPTSLEFLQRICANDLDRPVGSVVYTQLCNDRGGIECDLTITRLGASTFQAVTGTAFGLHDRAWFSKQAERLLEGAAITDVTAASSCLGLWGPNARTILQPLVETSLDNAAFPYLTAQLITVAAVPCLALRVTYVGELGWELYCPTEYGAALWEALWDAGQPHGLVPAGYRAIESLRLEKGYRAWAADISPEDTPYEAGLGFAVALDKPGGFIGRDALAAQRSTGTSRTLVGLRLADPLAVALGSEPVRASDGRILGRVTSGGQGYTVGASIAYAYVPSELAVTGTAVDVELFGDWIPATVSLAPFYDPRAERVRA